MSDSMVPSESSVSMLRMLLIGFTEGADRSKGYVAQIEEVLLRDFQGTGVFDALTEPVACYEPGGGAYLYDETALAKVFKEVLGFELK